MIIATHLRVPLSIEWHPTRRWYHPTFSPKHGVLLVLLGAVLTGAALAQTWTWQTSLAGLAAFLGVQAEHPLTVQIKQRRSLKPRYLLWSGLYGLGAVAIASWLTLQHPSLIWVCFGGAIAMLVNVMAVYQRRQKVISTELLMFAAICLSTLFVYGTTTDGITAEAIGFWVLNTLFFSSAIFTIKLRKVKTSSLQGALIFHWSAIAMIALL